MPEQHHSGSPPFTAQSPRLFDTHRPDHHSQESFISSNTLNSSISHPSGDPFLDQTEYSEPPHSNLSVHSYNYRTGNSTEFPTVSQLQTNPSQHTPVQPTLGQFSNSPTSHYTDSPQTPRHTATPPQRNRVLQPPLTFSETQPRTAIGRSAGAPSSFLRPIEPPVLQELSPYTSPESNSSWDDNLHNTHEFVSVRAPKVDLLPGREPSSSQSARERGELLNTREPSPSHIIVETPQGKPPINSPRILLLSTNKSCPSSRESAPSHYTNSPNVQRALGKPSTASNYSSDTPLLELIGDPATKSVPTTTNSYPSPFSSRSTSPVKHLPHNFGTAEIYKPLHYTLTNSISPTNKAFVKKVQLNPFDIVYEKSNNPSYTSTPIDQTKLLINKSYQEIDHEIQQGKVQSSQVWKKGHQRIISTSAPIITVIDDSELKRSGSIVSRDATLRYRGKLKSRHKMVNKHDMEDSDEKESGSRKQLRRFLFPVMRKRSLKYSRVQESRPNFETNKEIEKYLGESDYLKYVKDSFPKQMSLFSYSRLYLVNPRLHKITRRLSQLESARSHSTNPSRTLKISTPLQNSATKNGQPMEMLNKGLYDMAYNRYREEVFSQKSRTVPKFEQLYTNDLQIISQGDIEKLNKTMLLEVLLRRTLSAKIEYRLRQYGVNFSSSGDSGNSDSSSTYPSSSSKVESRETDRLGDSPPPLNKDSGSEGENGDELESVNTDILLQQNASLYSELLPSPQISYKSDMFELDLPKISPASAYSAAPKDTIDMSEIYINDFNKTYFRKYGRPAQTVSQTLEVPSISMPNTLSHNTNSRTFSNQTAMSVDTAISKYQPNSAFKRSDVRAASTPAAYAQTTISPDIVIVDTNRMVHSDGHLPHSPQNVSCILETLQREKSFTKLGKYRQDIAPTKLELDVKSMQGSLSVAESSTMNGSTN